MDTTPAPTSLQPASMVDSDHPAVIAFAQQHAQGSNDRERAVALYYAVRDGFRYDPYRIDLSVHGMKGSTVLDIGYGWCVPKAALLAAIPLGRLGSAEEIAHAVVFLASPGAGYVTGTELHVNGGMYMA